MDLEATKKQLAKSRRVEVPVAGATFVLELPHGHARQLLFEDHKRADGTVRLVAAFRALLDASLVGWDGVRLQHLLPDAPEDEAVAFSPEARDLLLDNRQDIANELAAEVGERLRVLRENWEAARKNLSSASSGNSTGEAAAT